MNIKGVHKTSLIDYPGKISSVFFTGGCNLRCKYCHNPELACNSCALSVLSDEDALSFAHDRRGLVDGVTISGGEPTLSPNLLSFVRSLKNMSFSVKLDTNGLNPEVVAGLLDEHLIDYFAVDVKTSPEKYPFLTSMPVDFSRIKETISMIKDSGVEYELRTTCIPYFVTLEDFARIKREVGTVRNYYLQQFVNDTTLDESLQDCLPYTVDMLEYFRDYVSTFADYAAIRGIK